MKHLFVYILLIFELNGISAQTINIKINNLNQDKAQLSYLRTGNYVFIDSLISTKNEFHYTFPRNAGHPGFYRLNISTNKWIDFIIDNEDVNLITDANNLNDSMKAGSSECNRLYYDFINLKKNYIVIKGLLQVIPAKYATQYQQFVNITSQMSSKSFAARYIKTVKLPVEDINLNYDNQVAYQRVHFLDDVDFNDDDLLYSDAFNIVSLKYLTLFRSPQMSRDLSTKELKSVADTILNKAKVNLLVYQNITEILIDKLKKLGFDTVIDYIVDNYVIKDDLCLDENLPGSIQQRIDQSKRFTAGVKVPNIILPDSTGKEVGLDNINSENTLILFYASWCPHCQKLLPQINDLYQRQRGIKLKIYAISLDTNRFEWLNFIRTNNYNWINVSDLRGGYGKTLREYKIYATPAMFLLNDKKELIAIPANIEDITKYFN
jgi:thiol-disulfide isomerase/thioredoxin